MCTHNLVSQNYFQSYQTLDVFSNQKADSLIALSIAQDADTTAAKIAHLHAIKRRAKGSLVDAIRYIQLEISTLEKAKSLDATHTHAIYILGRFYYENYEFENGILAYNRVISKNDYPLRIAQSYAEIGRCYEKLGELYKAVDYFEIAITKIEELGDYSSVINQVINLSIALMRIGDKESLNKRMAYLMKIDSLSQVVDLSIYNQYSLANAYGSHYASDHYYDFNKTREYFTKYLRLALAINDSLNTASALNNLTHLYNLERKDSALYFARQGLKFKSDDLIKAKLYENLSQYHLQRGEHLAALKNIDNALQTNLKRPLTASQELITYELNQANYKDHLLLCLQIKSEILLKLYHEESDTSYLQGVVKTSLSADQLIDIIQNNSTEGNSKLFWRREASISYLQGAKASNLLDDPKAVFYFMEKNKALLLLEEVANNTAFSGLPKNVSDRKDKLKEETLLLEDKLNALNPRDSLEAWKERLLISKGVYENFEDEVKADYPAYFQSHLQIEPTSLNKEKESLSDNEVLISFIWNQINGEDVILGLVTDNTETKTFEIVLAQEFRGLLQAYKQKVSSPLSTKKDQLDFQRIAAKLYQVLFPTQEIKAMIAGKDIKIIPDGELQNIPFEALIPDESNGEYLLMTSNIHYLYSASFRAYNHQHSRKAEKKFIGYAPINFNDDDLASLLNTETELKSISEIVDGNIQLNKEATKVHFIENSGAYDIVHLATHASEQGDPWVNFIDEKLELKELFNHKLNADLVVLSACNTSLGEVAKGEGVLSLTRGFFYAGTQSVVSTLWNVNDLSTSYIMTDFYRNLKNGQSKSEALNNAKRAYLENHSLSELSPYYWSSFVLTGDNQSVHFSDHAQLYVAAVVILILVLFFFFRKKSL